MAKDGRTYVKPGGLAQMKNSYGLIKQETIERNNKRVEALGFKPLPTSLSTSLLSLTQTTAEGKRKVDCDNDGDEDYHPAENEEGLFSSGDDDEFYWSEGKKRTVEMNKQRIVKKKRSRWPAGAMDATSQPSLTTSQQPPSPITDQTKPQPAATTQLYPPLTKTKKLPRWPVGAMAATSQPSPTTSQLPPSPITDQTLPQPATTQLYPPPTKTKKLPRWPVGAMAATSQPLPTTSQLPPSPITIQAQPRPAPDLPQAQPALMKKLPRFLAEPMAATSRPSPTSSQLHPPPPPLTNQLHAQPTPNQLQPLLTTNIPEPPPTVSRKRRSRRLDGSKAATRGRGPSRPYKYWGTGKKLEVVLDTKDQPIGDTGAILQSQLGILARNGSSQGRDISSSRVQSSPIFKEEVFTEVLGQDKHGRVRTYGLRTCPSQVFGTRFTRSQELRDREQLRVELRKEVVDEVRREVVDEVRKEVLAKFGDRFSSLERKCARFEAHAKDIGYPLAPSPEANSPIEPSHIRQLDDQIQLNYMEDVGADHVVDHYFGSY